MRYEKERRTVNDDSGDFYQEFEREDDGRSGSTECDCFLCRLNRGDEVDEVKIGFLSAEEIETIEDGGYDVFMRFRSMVDDLPTTNACQRRFINGVWVCQTEKTKCDHRRFVVGYCETTALCAHSNRLSPSPLTKADDAEADIDNQIRFMKG